LDFHPFKGLFLLLLLMQHQGSAGKLCLVLLAVLAGMSDALTHDTVHTLPSTTKKQVDRETLLAARTKRGATTSPRQLDLARSTPASQQARPLPAWAVAELDSLGTVALVMLLLTILIALMVWWSTTGRDSAPYVVVEPGGTQALCRGQMALAASSILATALLAADVPAPWAGMASTLGLLADSAVATVLLLRTLLCFVDGEHALALRAHLGGVNRWSLWFDVRANAGALQVAVVWVALSFALLLFALVSVSGVPLATSDSLRTQWHGLLSYLMLLPGVLLRAPADMPEPRAAVPRLALLLNAAAGVGVLLGAPAGVCLLFTGALAFGEAATVGRAPSRVATEADIGALVEAGALDNVAFEDFLHAERRLGVLFCFQELRRVDLAWRREERAELWSGWIERFARSGAPFQVPALPSMALENGSWAPGIEAAKARLMSDLAAAYARAALGLPKKKKASTDDVSTEEGVDDSDEGAQPDEEPPAG
jgi:hypothetical protein